MPRRRKPHHHAVRYLSYDPETPFEKLRAIYTRLSDDDPDSVSHEHQVEAAEILAAEQGLVITAIYQDWRTGFDPDRLALKHLIEDAHAGKHAGVIFYDHYRFYRGVTGCYPIVSLHAQLPTYRYTPCRDSFDIGHVGIYAGLSEIEAGTTKRRSTEQRRRRASEGQWMAGMKPYWLDRDAARHPVINGERAAHFLKAVSMYANGRATRECVAYLTNTAPIDPRRNASKVWTYQRFRGLMQNPAMYGALPYARTLEVKERRNGLTVVVKRKTSPDAIPFQVPPLIHKTNLELIECRMAGGCPRDDLPTFDELDVAIKRRDSRREGRPSELVHPLRRRVMCPCGWKMRFQVTRRGDKEWGFLLCARRHARGRTTLDVAPLCAVTNVSALLVWPKVRDMVIAAVRQPERLVEEIREQMLKEAALEARTAAEESAILAALTSDLSAVDDAEDELYTDWKADKMSESTYDRQRSKQATRRRELEEQKRQILSQRVVYARAEDATVILRSALRELAELPLERLSLEQWTPLLADLVSWVQLDNSAEPMIIWKREA